MHDLLQEMKSPLAFAVVAFVVYILRRVIKGEIGDHTELLHKELRAQDKRLTIMETRVDAAWRHIDKINSGHGEEE